MSVRFLAGLTGLAYVVLFLGANFPTGVGDHIYGQHTPAAVASWALAHPGLVHGAVIADLVDDWLFALFAFMLITTSGSRTLPAVIGYAGVAATETVYAVIRGLQYSLPQLAELPDGNALAQAAIVVQTSLVFSVQSLLLAIGLTAIGYLLLRSAAAPKAFGGLALALAMLFAIAFPVREMAPALGPFETAAGVGVLLWTASLSVALLLRRPAGSGDRQRVRASEADRTDGES